MILQVEHQILSLVHYAALCNLEVMATILWRGIVFPGHEACRLVSQESGWQLVGTAVFAHEGQICRLNFQVLCDLAWRTISAKVEGWLGEKVIDSQIKTGSKGRWWLNE